MVKLCMRQMSLVRVICHTKVTACYVSLILTAKAGLGFSDWHPLTTSFLHAVYGARNSHLKILKLDEALRKRDFSVLMKASSVSLDTSFSVVKEHMHDI